MFYFQSLTVSMLIHTLVWVGLYYFSAPTDDLTPTPIEIIYEDKLQKQSFVTQTKSPKELKKWIKKLKKKVKYLSQYSQRVKEQMVAKNSGETINSQPQRAIKKQQKKSKRKPPTDDGLMGVENISSLERRLQLRSSSIAEYIPDVKKGGFTSLNTNQFLFYTFYSRVNEQVRYRWVENLRRFANSLSYHQAISVSNQTRVTRMEIILDSEGHFLRSIVHKSSGFKKLDQTSIDAIKTSINLIKYIQITEICRKGK